jgi:trans-aconitate methyltransferase
MSEPGDITLASYEAAAHRYRDHALPPGESLLALLDRVAQLVGSGEVLELGSGPGREARYLERFGLRVHRTDATRAFVEMMREDGFEARLLDIRTGDYGGPYDAILANAVLLHLTRDEFSDALVKARRAVIDGGVLALTLKEGAGEAWSNAKLGLPRHFTFWREPPLRAVLKRTGWTVESVAHVPGRTEPWLHVVALAR